MLNCTETENSLTCKFASRMDTYNSQEIEKELNVRLSQSDKPVIFDLEDVMFISSYFLRICLTTLKTAGFDKFRLKNVRSDIKKVFMIAGYDKYMNIG